MEPVDMAAAPGALEHLRRLLAEDPRRVLQVEPEKALHIACGTGSLEAARLVLDRGIDINIIYDDDGCTPLLCACAYGHADVAALLLARGADTGAVSPDGSTALILAASCQDWPGSDHVAVIRLLIEDGRVPINARDSEGCSALAHACVHGHTERARALLVEGRADHTIYHEGGMRVTALDFVQHNNHQGCIELLQWYEGELERAFMLTRARAVVDDAESISRAAEKVGARTRAEAQLAREEAAPVYLRGRVSRGEALPVVEVVMQAGTEEEEEEEEEEERRAVWEFVVRRMKEDLVVEMMQGLRFRWQLSTAMREEMRQQESRGGWRGGW